MAGAAVIVSLQQLKGLLGIVHFTTKMQLVPVLSSVFHHRDEVENLAKIIAAKSYPKWLLHWRESRFLLRIILNDEMIKDALCKSSTT